MKTIVIVFILLFSALLNVCPQASIFRMYRFECSELYNINLVKPKGFDVIDGANWFIINKKNNIGMPYRMILQSKNKDCLILFPLFCSNTAIPTFAIKNMCFREVKAALNLDPQNRTIELDTAKFIKKIAENNMKDYFNADTVFIYKVSLPKPYKETYTQCIGINIIKTGHPSAVIKILLTENGKKKENEYLQSLFNCIHYSNIDTIPVLNQKLRNEVRKKMKLKFFFYNRKKYFYL